MAAFLLAVFFLATFASPARAGLDEGFAALERGDYETAFDEFLPLARAGDPYAQAGIGTLYDEGYGVTLDHAEAVKWYRRAAEQGYAFAQYRLAVLYGKGEGVPQDPTEAAKWCRWAAEQGLADAQYTFGSLYVHGEGVLQDYGEAARWFRRAAEQGHAEAQKGLGLAYVLEYGVPRDLVLAYVWLNLSATRLTPGKGRDQAVNARDMVAEELSPPELARAQQMTREWQPKVETDQ